MVNKRKIHTQPPFRAEHIGSFLRPNELHQRRVLFEKNEINVEDLHKAEDDAIKTIVNVQRAIGIRSITDGEFRRNVFHDGVFDKLEGVKAMIRPIDEFLPYASSVSVARAQGLTNYPSFYCNGKIKRTESFRVEDFKFLKGLVQPRDVKHIKVTMCATSWIHQRHGSNMTYDKTVYNNDDEYFQDLAIAYRAEIMELYDLGCRNIQIDNPSFCFLCDEGMIASMEKAGQDPEALLDLYIRATNMYTANRPDDLTIGVHMCRGNFRGKHFAEGSYAQVAQKMFNELDVDVFYLEYDDVTRVGDFTPLKHLPRNKVAVLGLVTTKKPELETVEQLEAQVNQAVNAICEGSKDRTREEALNQLCISTQCGFASEWHGNPITEEDQQKKLELLVKAAKHIWRETDLHDSEVI